MATKKKTVKDYGIEYMDAVKAGKLDLARKAIKNCLNGMEKKDITALKAKKKLTRFEQELAAS